MPFDTDKACGEIIARVAELCEKERSVGLDPREEGKLEVLGWSLALNLSDRYVQQGVSPGAVIVSRLGAKKGASIERQGSPVESGFDIVVSPERYDLLATMRDLWAMREPVARKPQ